MLTLASVLWHETGVFLQKGPVRSIVAQKEVAMKSYALVLLLAMSFWSICGVMHDAIGADRQEFVCGRQQTINDILKRLKSGDILFVRGNCNENISIPEEIQNVTIDGQGQATISGVDAPNVTATIIVRSKGITIKNFAGITGATDGILVTRDSSATIDNNVIQNTGRNGILVSRETQRMGS